MRVTLHFDPGCPWTWVTSRWLVQAAADDGFDLEWSPLSLHHLHRDDPESDGSHDAPPAACRVVQHLVERGDHDAAGRFYAAYGERVQLEGRPQDDAIVREAATAAGLDESALAALDDPTLDAAVGQVTEAAVEAAGCGVGSPVITWDDDAGQPVAVFGPILAAPPRPSAAAELWRGVKALAGDSCFHELKRGGRPDAPVRLSSPVMPEGSDHLRITTDTSGAPTRLRLDGELDVHTAPDLSAAIDSALDGGSTDLVIDAANLRFCDSSGIQALVQGRDRLVDAGGSLTIEGVHGAVEKVLVVTGVLDLFTS